MNDASSASPRGGCAVSFSVAEVDDHPLTHRTGIMIEQRLDAIEARFAIMDLKARYLDACDGGWDRSSHDADSIAEMFAPDALWEAEGFPPLHGREAIRQAFRAFSTGAPFAYHHIGNPRLTISGDRAAGEWHLIEFFLDAEGTESCAAGIYKNRFVRADGAWMFQELRLSYAYSGPFRAGWGADTLRKARTFVPRG